MNELKQTSHTFLQILEDKIASGSFIKGTLSKTSGNTEWNAVYFKLIEIKKQLHLSLLYRFPTRDETHNYAVREGIELLDSMLSSDIVREAYLFNQNENIQFKRNKKGIISTHFQPVANTNQLSGTVAHDRAKSYLMPANHPLLMELGISSSKGEILKEGKKKYKQINKYLEIVYGLLSEHVNGQIRIADMGSGSGYLTFSLYWYLKVVQGLDVHITGIELREALVEKSNNLARKFEYEDLNFVTGDIQITSLPESINVLIALHACDTATDMAIARGIEHQVEVMVLAPCCQKQIRKDMQMNPEMKPLLKHGILLERQCEMLTDGIRALILEAHGYRSSVFEFISPEHTAKNVMITAVKSKERPEALVEVDKLKQAFGIKAHYLENLLSKQ